MPSPTPNNFNTLANLGPLTTTFTAAPSCATPSAPWVYVGVASTDGFLAQPCPLTGQADSYVEGCWPSAAAANDMSEALTPAAPTNRVPQMRAYYSPGLHCPAGWTTAGTMAWEPASTTPTGVAAASITGPPRRPKVSGVFAGRDYDLASGMAGRILLEHDFVFYYALDAGETMAYCCPSGAVAIPQGGICASSIGTATDTELCVWDRSGITTMELTATGGFWRSTATLPATIYHVASAVPLLWRATDRQGAGPAETGAAEPTKNPNTGARRTSGSHKLLFLGIGLMAFYISV